MEPIGPTKPWGAMKDVLAAQEASPRASTGSLNFKQGDTVAAIFIDGGSFRVGGMVSRIEVVMEYGQMAGVPWFVVFDQDGKAKSKWNGAHIEGVEYF